MGCFFCVSENGVCGTSKVWKCEAKWERENQQHGRGTLFSDKSMAGKHIVPMGEPSLHGHRGHVLDIYPLVN